MTNSPRPRASARLWSALALLVAVLVWACTAWLAGPFIDRLDERSADLAWRLHAQARDEQRLIIVDIDENSLREIGPWPWPRETQARLMQQLAEAGAALQIYDIVFADDRPGDPQLAQALQAHQPVLAQVFALEQGQHTQSGQLAGALPWPGCPAPFESARGYLANTASAAQAVHHAGHITPRIAPDGVMRHLPAIICHQGQAYPALALSALLAGTGETDLTLRRGHGWFDAPWQLHSAALVQGGIPLDARGDLRVPWRLAPESFVSLSAVDVLQGRIPPGLLKQNWVLIGSTAFGLHDAVATPFGGADAGVQVHAQALVGLIDGRMPYTPRAAPLLQLLAALLGLFMLFALKWRLPAAIYLQPLAAWGWAGLLWAGHAWALTAGALQVGWTSPALFVIGAGLALGAAEHARSRFDRDRLYAHLSSYLPAPVAAALALQSPSSAITASEQRVSVLFADIRNFSAYVEARPPEEAAAVLQTLFETATRIVHRHGGVIEAFQGDAVLAVWSGQASQENKALQAAVELQRAMLTSLPDPAPAGLEPLALGIGLETGPALLGSFGPASRRTHLVLGRTVTVASRLVDMTAELAHPILVGEGMAAQLGAGTPLQSMGTFLLEGLRVPHHIYAWPLAPVAPDGRV